MLLRIFLKMENLNTERKGTFGYRREDNIKIDVT
jgi:hypothetical protein